MGDDRLKWLGVSLTVLGAVPFVLLAAIAARSSGSDWAVHGITAYAVAVVSFVGAIHWGAALGASSHSRLRSLQMIWSVYPAVLASLAVVFLRDDDARIFLACLFVACLLVDWIWLRCSVLQRWYFLLRVPVTVVVCACLIGVHTTA